MPSPFSLSSSNRRAWTALLVLSPLAVVFAAGESAAQLARPTVALPRNPVQDALDKLKVDPVVLKIAAIGTDQCKTRPLAVYEKGVSPNDSANPGQPYAETVGGAVGLRLIGPLMDEVEFIFLKVGSGPLQELRLSDRIAPSAACNAVFGQGNGAISVELPLPLVTSITTGKLQIHGRSKSGLKVDPARIAAIRQDATPATGPTTPAPMAEEVHLKIFPVPKFSSVNPDRFASSTPAVTGSTRFVGENLAGTLLSGPSDVSMSTTGTTATTLSADVAMSIPTVPMSIDRSFNPAIPMIRGAARVPVNGPDTRVDSRAASFSFSWVNLKFTHRAPTTEPTPEARLSGFDPGNILYKVGSTDTNADRYGNDYALLNSTTFCSGLATPGAATSAGNDSTRRIITVPDIKWGVRNAGDASAAGQFVAELWQAGVGRGTPKAVFTFSNLAAGATIQAPQPFRRPVSDNMVALLSNDSRCWHGGTAQTGWNDDAGWFVSVRGVANSGKKLGD